MSIKTLLTRILNWIGLVDDYIVERGTDGGWIYEKWNSGIAKAWFHEAFDPALTPSFTRQADGCYSSTSGWSNHTITLPANLFTSVKYANCDVESNTYVVSCIPSIGVNAMNIRAWTNFAASPKIVGTAMEVVGTWKNRGGCLKALFSRLSAIFARGWQYVFKGITGPNHKCFKSRLYSGARHERNLDISKVEQWHCGMLGSLERVSEFYPFLGRDVYMRLNECKFPDRPIHCDSVCHVFKFRRRFSRSVQRWFGYSVSSSYPTWARFKRKRHNFQRADFSKRTLEITPDRGCFA